MIRRYFRQFIFVVVAIVALATPTIFNACTGDSDNSGPVTGLMVTPGNGQNTLKWDKAAGTSAYDIVWSVDTGTRARTGLDSLLDASPTTESNVIQNVTRNSYVHHGLMNGWTYSYLVVSAGFDHSLLTPSVSGIPGAQFNCVFEGQTYCSGRCISLETNNGNCGACGNACPATHSCIGGVCEDTTNCPDDYPVNCAPSSSTTLMCRDTQFDSENCGACGNVCEEGLECSYGYCERPGYCPDPDSVDCLGNAQQPPGWFVCTNILWNIYNCGACGNECWVGETCREGMCVPNDTAGASCGRGETKCGDLCVDTGTDMANCGSCGNVCSEGRNCVEGICFTPPSCSAGQTLCGNSCKDTNTDFNNCGACGNACSPSTSKVCSGGLCI